MYCVLKIETKINVSKTYDCDLGYNQTDIIAVVPTLEKAQDIMGSEIENTVKRGYFRILLDQSERWAKLTNGGSVFLTYEILHMEMRSVRE